MRLEELLFQILFLNHEIFQNLLNIKFQQFKSFRTQSPQPWSVVQRIRKREPRLPVLPSRQKMSSLLWLRQVLKNTTVPQPILPWIVVQSESRVLTCRSFQNWNGLPVHRTIRNRPVNWFSMKNGESTSFSHPLSRRNGRY